MAKKSTKNAGAPNPAQVEQELQEVSQDTQVQEAASGAVEGQQEAVGQDTDETELEETEFIEYAVTAKGGLRLREEPNLNAPVVAVLPCGVGVLGNTRPAENGWRQVFTGRLFGWVMDKCLEPLELDCDDG